ncbi:beta-ketoacyl synthase N-terminal-like domain-containing protein [Aliikangiella maris]|uniref:Beta-ketoacyl synthase N-terminal-like domain-containing protein n=2 Tax=Aliikangiella maris TaxID=3162458 RepID=A0ABV2BU97_9GAMM
MNLVNESTGFEIAIIGIACQLPGAKNVAEFWELLVAGENAISYFDEQELINQGIDANQVAQKNYVKAKGVFPEIACFDWRFFGYTPKDAAIMDPQVRALHQGVYHALEDAGCLEALQESGKSKGRNIGLFASASGNFNWELDTYLQIATGSAAQFAALQLNDKDFLATRLAYAFDLRGPACTLHTACSSSLYSVDVACRNLYTGACEAAVVAASGLSLPVKNGYVFEEGMIKSPEGKCRPFSEGANGTVEGNGMGVVVLKPLEDAQENNDNIYAVIRGISANNDGQRKVGYVAPSIEGQVEVIRRAMYMAEVNAESIGYVETHGTATELGDPIEIQALIKAFATDQKQYCTLGALKSNIGHLDTAAGVAALIKASLVLKHRQLPPNANLTAPSENINFAESPFKLSDELREWQRIPHPEQSDAFWPLRAGVSSFGIGGTNAHVILEENIQEALAQESLDPVALFEQENLAKNKPQPDNILCLSAKTQNALNRIRINLHQFIQQNPTISVADLCFSYAIGRESHEYRHFYRVSTIEQLEQQLAEDVTALSDEENNLESTGLKTLTAVKALTNSPRIAFLFPGQGTQYAGMSRSLYEQDKTYQGILDTLLAICDAQQLFHIRRMLLQPTDADAEAIHLTANSQLCLFVTELALAHYLMSLGIKPDAMIGHSLGEIVAATVAEVLTVEDAIHLVNHRGRLMQSMQSGAMLVVLCTKDALQEVMTEHVEIAAMNTPEQFTVSGTHQAIEEFCQLLDKNAIIYRPIKTSHAFHSSMMDGVLPELKSVIQGITLNEAKTPYLSNLTGDWISGEQNQDETYFLNHLRQAVNFLGGIETLLADQNQILIEVGPGNVLGALVKQIADANQIVMDKPVSVLRQAKIDCTDETYFIEALGKIWSQGVSIHWQSFYQQKQIAARRISTPGYPFEKSELPVGNGDVNHVFNTHLGNLGNLTTESNGLTDNQTSAKQPVKSDENKQIVPYYWDWKTELLTDNKDKFSVKSCFLFALDKKGFQLFATIGGLRMTTIKINNVTKVNPSEKLSIAANESDAYQKLLAQKSINSELPELFVWFCASEKSEDIEKTKLQISRGIKTITNQYPNKHFDCILCIGYRTPIAGQINHDINLWCRSTNLLYPNINVKCIELDLSFNDPLLLQNIEAELFNQFEYQPLVRLSQGRRQVWGMNDYRSEQVQSINNTLPSAHRILVMALEQFPLIDFISQLDHLTKARVTGLSLSVNQAKQQQVIENVIAKDRHYDQIIIIDSYLSCNYIQGEKTLASISDLDKTSLDDAHQLFYKSLLQKINKFDCQSFIYLSTGSASWLDANSIAHYKVRSDFEKRLRTQIKDKHLSTVFLPFEESVTHCEFYLPDQQAQRALLSVINSGWHQVTIKPEMQALFAPVSSLMQPGLLHEKSQDEVSSHSQLSQAEVEQPESYLDDLQKYWSQILGITEFSPQDNFFELGGDSLRVAQLTAELEKNSISVSPNVVFNYPDLQSLADYLESKFPRNQHRIKTIVQLTEKLNEALPLAFGYRLFPLNESMVNHSHTEKEKQRDFDDKLLDKQLLDKELLDKQSNSSEQVSVLYTEKPLTEADLLAMQAILKEQTVEFAALPNYICQNANTELFTTNDESNVTQDIFSGSEKSLNDELYLKAIDEEQLERLLNNVRFQQKRFGRNLVNAPIETIYKVSPFQKMYLKSDTRVSLYEMFINKYFDLELLNKSVTKIINNQGLLRSSLARNYNGLYWEQHERTSRVNLPYIDISQFNEDSKQAIVEKLMSQEYETDFDAENTVLYHVIVIRLDYKRINILFNLDHSIFDNMSGQVMQRHILDDYDARLMAEYQPSAQSHIKSYDFYLENLNKGPQGITEEKLIQLFELNQFNQAKLAIEQKIIQSKNEITANTKLKNKNQFKYWQYKITLPSINGYEEEDLAWQITTAGLSYSLARYFGQAEIPMKLLYQGRKYHDISFFDTLGLFIDVVPLLIDTTEKNPTSLIGRLSEKLQYINRYNINFMNMVMSIPMLIKWRNILGLISAKKLSQKDPMILLNHTGKSGTEYRKIIDFATKEMLDSGKIDYASFYVISSVVEGELILDILCCFENDMEKIGNIIKEEFQNVIDYFKAGEQLPQEKQSKPQPVGLNNSNI